MTGIGKWGAIALAILVAGCGWTHNQKAAVKMVVTKGALHGLQQQGMTIDKKTLGAFGDCVVGKVVKHWKTFEDFRAHQGGPVFNKMMHACDVAVGYDQNIVFERAGIEKYSKIGAKKALEKEGKTVDQKTLDAFGKCVADEAQHSKAFANAKGDKQGDLIGQLAAPCKEKILDPQAVSAR